MIAAEMHPVYSPALSCRSEFFSMIQRAPLALQPFFARTCPNPWHPPPAAKRPSWQINAGECAARQIG